jgi:hypothetical protein
MSDDHSQRPKENDMSSIDDKFPLPKPAKDNDWSPLLSANERVRENDERLTAHARCIDEVKHLTAERDKWARRATDRCTAGEEAAEVNVATAYLATAQYALARAEALLARGSSPRGRPYSAASSATSLGDSREPDGRPDA